MTFGRIFPGRPTTLFVVVVAIAVMSVFGLAETGIKIVGEIPTGLPAISVPNVHLSDISALVPIALACVLLAYGETISVARSFAQKHGYDISPEQELTALGATNVATGLAQGFPVAGGMSRTAVNDMGGASLHFPARDLERSVALTLLFLRNSFTTCPKRVLAAVVLMAASHMVRLDDLRQLRILSRPSFAFRWSHSSASCFWGCSTAFCWPRPGLMMMVVAHASRRRRRPGVSRLGFCEPSRVP